jgi:hypothetical protein
VSRRLLRPAQVLVAMAGALALATVHVGGASAAHVARLEVRPGQVAAGEEIAVFGPPGWAPSPVSIRWNGLEGEVLGTFTTTTGGNASFGPGTVRIPDVGPGTYELVGIQDVPENQPQVRGVPARARITVTGPGGATPPAVAETPPVQGLRTLKEAGASTGALVLVGLGVFAVTLAAGLLAGWAIRRRAVAP